MPQKKYTNCHRCRKPIYYGNAYISIVRNIEQIDFSIASNCDEATVIASDELLVLCGSCGNLFNTELIVQIISSIPTDGNNPALN